MVIRSTPIDLVPFILIDKDSDLSYVLQENGFYPLYIDSDYLYFVRNKEIEKFLKEKGGDIIE